MKKKLIFLALVGLVASCTRPGSPPDVASSTRTAPEMTQDAEFYNQLSGATQTPEPTNAGVPATLNPTEESTSIPTATATLVALFSDYQTNMWGYMESVAMYQAGLVNACQESPEQKFCPKDNVSRLDFLLGMANALQLSPQTAQPDNGLLDVSELGDEQVGLLTALRAEGYYPEALWCKAEYLNDANRYMCPDGNINVRRFEAFAASVLIGIGPGEFTNIQSEDYVGYFKDYSRGSVMSGENVGLYVAQVERTVQEGIYTIGLRPFLFDPVDNIHKDQWAVLLYRALELKGGA